MKTASHRYFFNCVIAALLIFIPLACGKAKQEETAMTTNFKKPAPETLKEKLSPLQFKVTQQNGTEAPFQNEFWNNKEDGIYVDVVSGEPLFSSLDKFDSGTGWPSFTKPLKKENIVNHTDNAYGMSRTEVRSSTGDSHLGHVFDDGPGPGGQRYCINSASLRFIPLGKMESEGYGQYLSLFGEKKKVSPVNKEVATLAGGCFWGMEDLIRKIPGVISTAVGYTGGTTINPEYDDVKMGTTGHAESLEVTFDPSILSFEDLLVHFFKIHDPTTKNRQGNDVGTQYRSAIFYHSEAQQKAAEKIKARVEASGKWKKPIVTEIVKATEFYPAEDYHQDYLKKHPGGYTCHFERNIEF